MVFHYKANPTCVSIGMPIHSLSTFSFFVFEFIIPLIQSFSAVLSLRSLFMTQIKKMNGDGSTRSDCEWRDSAGFNDEVLEETLEQRKIDKKLNNDKTKNNKKTKRNKKKNINNNNNVDDDEKGPEMPEPRVQKIKTKLMDINDDEDHEAFMKKIRWLGDKKIGQSDVRRDFNHLFFPHTTNPKLSKFLKEEERKNVVVDNSSSKNNKTSREAMKGKKKQNNNNETDERGLIVCGWWKGSCMESYEFQVVQKPQQVCVHKGVDKFR